MNNSIPDITLSSVPRLLFRSIYIYKTKVDLTFTTK